MQEDQNDRVLSTSEDPLPCLQSKAEPLTRSRPLSDIFPINSHGDRSAVPYLLSGCTSHVQPVTGGLDETRLNNINSSSWSNPVIGPPEGKPYSSRIMKLFSNAKKGPVPPHNPTTADSTTTTGLTGPQAWPGLSGLGVVDSFKKLRTSVLQGIQSRGAVGADGEQDSGQEDPPNHFKLAEGLSCSNGNVIAQKTAAAGQYGSDIEDDEDEEENEGDGLTRNTRFSRSIRRAYGAGRISLFDAENRRLAGKSTNEAADGQKPDQTSKAASQTDAVNGSTNVTVLSRLSKSADNLHIFKAPFRRKAASPGPASPQEGPQVAGLANGKPSIQRTASASSVDLRGRKKSPVKTKGPMLKLVGSMSDLTVRRRRSPSPGATSPALMSPLSRLHDDYSRRVPCLTTCERQRRPSPVRARVLSVGHAPLIHPQPQHQVLISPEPPERAGSPLPGGCAHYEAPAVATTGAAEGDWSPVSQKEPSPQPEHSQVSQLADEVRE